MFDYIFCDFDGPILNGIHKHYFVYKQIITKYGGVPLTQELYWELKRAKVKRDVMLNLSQFSGTYDDFFREWLGSIEQPEALEKDMLQPGVEAALSLLVRNSEHLWLVSMRQSVDSLQYQLTYFGIKKYFTKIVECPPLNENTKYNALRHLRISRGLFIGDTEEDQSTAKLLNLPFLAVWNGLRRPDLLQSKYHLNSLADLNEGYIIGIE